VWGRNRPHFENIDQNLAQVLNREALHEKNVALSLRHRSHIEAFSPCLEELLDDFPSDAPSAASSSDASSDSDESDIEISAATLEAYRRHLALSNSS